MKKILSIILLIGLAMSAQAQLLWKISGKGLEKPSYLFGTYHLSPLSIKDSIAAMPKAIEETAQVYGEVVMADAMKPEVLQAMQLQMMLPQDSTLQSLFTPTEYEQVGKMVKEYMMADIAMLARLKPAAINQQLTLLICMKYTPGFNPQMQLDSYFQQQAQQAGKKVGGLEEIAKQTHILFNSQSLRRQAALLACLAADPDKAMDQCRRLVEAYEKQDLDTMLRLMEERDGTSCDPLPEELEQLIDERNKAWVAKMPAIMTEAPTLFVVGAGHLPGENGVINLLRQQGYTLEAMQ